MPRCSPESITCKYDDVPADFFGLVDTTPSNNSTQNMLDVLNEINDYGRGNWFTHDESWAYPAPVDDSFSDLQLYRARGPFECRRLKFDVQLWAAVNMRTPIAPQMVESLKKMAAFLQSKAAEIERMMQSHIYLLDAPTVDHEVHRAARIAARQIALAQAARTAESRVARILVTPVDAPADEFGAGLPVDAACCVETDNPCVACAEMIS
jgi:hypothetical protein